MKITYLDRADLNQHDVDALWSQAFVVNDIKFIVLVATDYLDEEEQEDEFGHPKYYVEHPFLKSIAKMHDGEFEWRLGEYRDHTYAIGVAYLSEFRMQT